MKSQTAPFKENLKWGIKENTNIIIKPVYDTIFNFDNSGKVCLACYKTKVASANKFMKSFTTVYNCNYLNKQGDKLKIKTNESDTCSVFSLVKNSVSQFNDDEKYFIVSSKNKKYLINKDFTQTIFTGYNEIFLTADPNFIITEIKNEGGIVYTGLNNFKEEQVVPYSYSSIKINPIDSLIVGCTAGLGGPGEDDIYDYSGKKVAKSLRHIDMATKNYVIHKIFEPREYYILLDSKTKEETIFGADEVLPFAKDEALIRVKHDWFTFNLESKQRKPYKK
ncbi:MAG: hypothetical protein Q7W45_13325 [Bacteroidota bacterium]|nr:hypothetical protein [Bacteroidota bacterium]MDP3144498.1 hypothetical protein [Bacteroidota bacterium]MDP3555821.1 hypothetical protein [Bacteroidota bacterium]